MIFKALFAKLAGVLISYFRETANNVMNAQNEENANEQLETARMVCWLTAMAQPYLKVIKTQKSFRLIQTIEQDVFNQIKVEIENSDRLESIKEEEVCDDLGFIVEIHTIQYADTKYNKYLLKFENWKNRWKKSISIEKDINENQYIGNFNNANLKKRQNILARKLELRYKPIHLYYRLCEYLPCGIAKFNISLKGDADLDLTSILRVC